MAPSKRKKSTAKKPAPAIDEPTPQASPSQVPDQPTELKQEPTAIKPSARSRKASQSKATSSTANLPQPTEPPQPQESGKHPVVLVPSYQPPSADQSSALSNHSLTNTPAQQATKKRRRSSANPKAPELSLNAPVEQQQEIDNLNRPARLSRPVQSTDHVQSTQHTQFGEATASQPPSQAHTQEEKSSLTAPQVSVSANTRPHIRRPSEQSNQIGVPTQAGARLPLPSERSTESAAPKQAESRKPLPKERPKQPPRQKKPPAQREWATVADQPPANPLPQPPAAMESMPPPPKKQKTHVPEELIDQRTGFRKGVVVSSSLQSQGANGGQNEQQDHVQNAQAVPQGRNIPAHTPEEVNRIKTLLREVYVNRHLSIPQLTPQQRYALEMACKEVLGSWANFVEKSPEGKLFKEGKLTKDHILVRGPLQKMEEKIQNIPHPWAQRLVRHRMFGAVPAPPQRPNQIQAPQLPPMNFPGWNHQIPQQHVQRFPQSVPGNHQGVNNQDPQPNAQQAPQPLAVDTPGSKNQSPQQQAQQSLQPSQSNLPIWNDQGLRQVQQPNNLGQAPHAQAQALRRQAMNVPGGSFPVKRVEVRPGNFQYIQASPPLVPEEELEEVETEPVGLIQEIRKQAKDLVVEINPRSTGVSELAKFKVGFLKNRLEREQLEVAKATEEEKPQAKQRVIETKEELHQRKFIKNMLQSLRHNLPHRNKPPVGIILQLNTKTMPDFQELALGHIKVCNPNSGNPLEHCTFCSFDCDYGIANEFFQLPYQASVAYCKTCKYKEVQFLQGYFDGVKPDDTRYRRCEHKLRANGFKQTHPLEEIRFEDGVMELALSYQICKPTPHNTTSNLDGQDISLYRGLIFCRGCPWTQLDVRKARICGECKAEKLKILQHRHRQFKPIVRHADTTEKDRRCMLCPATALEKCVLCPLRLCETCTSSVQHGGKGWINNAMYNYSRVHLRNDAFLLRSDGGGF